MQKKYFSIILVLLFLTLPINASKKSTYDLPTTSHVTSSDVAEEQAFQENIDELFESGITGIDTTGWNNGKINTVWFDYRTLDQMVAIPLVDSSCSRYFTPPCYGHITSPFGARDGFWHFGTDIKVRVGDTIRSTFNGIVRIIQNDRRGYGKVIVIRHHNGLETLYGHLSKTLVKVNQVVCSGEVIGLGGNTGRSSGSHLHFESRYCGEPFNPCNIVDFERCSLLYDTLYLTKENFDYLTELRKTIFHTIRKGDNLGSIARRYRTSVGSICALNGIKASTTLRIGRKIVVRKPTEIEIAGENTATDSLKNEL
jgi:hypothetical protein